MVTGSMSKVGAGVEASFKLIFLRQSRPSQARDY
jgi:hypothetical protein